MTEKNIQQINRLYLYFMATHPHAGLGTYLASDTNCVLAFAEYVDEAEFIELKTALPELRRSQLNRFKKRVQIAIEDYLLRHAKVLALS